MMPLCPDCLEVQCECKPRQARPKKIRRAGSGQVTTIRPLSSSEARSGRGPSGKLRNFKAMTTEKLENVLETLMDEDNDPEAIQRADVALAMRRNIELLAPPSFKYFASRDLPTVIINGIVV